MLPREPRKLVGRGCFVASLLAMTRGADSRSTLLRFEPHSWQPGGAVRNCICAVWSSLAQPRAAPRSRLSSPQLIVMQHHVIPATLMCWLRV